MLIETLEQVLKNVLKECGLDENHGKIIVSNRPDLCDYQFDGVFRLASLQHRNPIDIGEEIVEKMQKDSLALKYFSKIEFVKPGFINFTLSDEFINEYLCLMNDNAKFNIKLPEKKEKFLLDYGGYNIAKPLHIGHLRPSIIGEALKRIISYMGHDTIADVHLGDYGLQLGQVIYGIKRDNIKIDEITIDYLNKIYPEISALCKQDENIKEECANITKELQEVINEEVNALWQKIMEVSLSDVKELCSYLDVSYDLWEGESDAYKILPIVEKYLQDKNLLEESEGALVINVKKDDDNKPMPPIIFKKNNGAYLYDSTDLATIYDRFKKYNPDHIIYVTDFRQSLHFEQVFRASDKANIIPYEKLEHAYIGTINGKDNKPFKTRSGEAPKLRDLFHEVEETFLNNREENKNMKEEDIAIIVNAIIKYADFQNNRDKDYIFDLQKFSEVTGKTGPYILYTYVRINKLIENEQKHFTKLGNNIYNKQDRDLRLKILNLESALKLSFINRMPSHLANYLYDLCVLLNAFYQNNNISKETMQEKRNDWLYILNLANNILKEMLSLLIIDIPSEM